MNVKSTSSHIGVIGAVLFVATMASLAWMSSRRTAGDSTGLTPPIHRTAPHAEPLKVEPPPIDVGISSERLPFELAEAFEPAEVLGSVEKTGEGNGASTGNEPKEPYMEASGSPDTWTLEYAELDAEQLKQESEKITAYITPLARDDLMRRWELGIYEKVSTDGTVKMTQKDAREFFPGLVWIIHRQDKEVRRYQVAESEYPDLYALGRKGLWFSEEAQKRTREKWH